MKPRYHIDLTPRETAAVKPAKPQEGAKFKLRRFKSPPARPNFLKGVRIKEWPARSKSQDGSDAISRIQQINFHMGQNLESIGSLLKSVNCEDMHALTQPLHTESPAKQTTKVSDVKSRNGS